MLTQSTAFLTRHLALRYSECIRVFGVPAADWLSKIPDRFARRIFGGPVAVKLDRIVCDALYSVKD